MSLNSLIILHVMLLDFESFLESNRLIAMDIRSLSTFVNVTDNFNSAHLFFIASIFGW